MKKLSIIGTFLIISFGLFGSCSKDTAKSIEGKWKITDLTFENDKSTLLALGAVFSNENTSVVIKSNSIDVVDGQGNITEQKHYKLSGDSILVMENDLQIGFAKYPNSDQNKIVFRFRNGGHLSLER